ncbi:MAG TPA: glutamine amidotransferase, partial [Pirellulales bacterium]|nr:glutamine amidotransferase [Pirellulales bacterium]
KVVVGSQGYAGRRAEIVVRNAAEPQAQPLAALPITLADGEQTHDLTLEADRAAGKLVVEVPPLNGEAIVENNRVAWMMNARDSKIRVIYMEGTGVNEYRWIRDALVEDPSIECLAMEVNTQYAERQMLHRIDNPQLGYPSKREELLSYDVVICSDISRLAFTQEQLDWTVELVAQRGGGFAMIGGNTSFGAGNWDQTAWDGMIPVDMSGAVGLGAGTIWGVQIRTVVPPEAESHPIWHIVDDPLKNHEVLARIPTLFGTNRTDRLKPAATVLGVAGAPLQGVVAMPIFTCQTYGRGRSFAMSSDSTVDWGRDFERLWGEGDNRYFRKFWRNVVEWLAENSRGKNRRLQVETDKLMYRPGEPIGVTARAYDDELRATGKYRVVSRLLPVRAAGLPNATALDEAALVPRTQDVAYVATHAAPALELVPPLGGSAGSSARRVQIEVTAYEDDRQVAQVVEEAQLSDDSPEYRDLRPDAELLGDLARSSGGKVLAGAKNLAAELASYTDTPGEVAVYRSPLWDRAWLWCLLLTLLSAEWIVRRMKGLA